MKLEMKCKGKECHNAKLKFSSRGAFRASLNFHEDDVFNNPFNHGQYQEKHVTCLCKLSKYLIQEVFHDFLLNSRNYSDDPSIAACCKIKYHLTDGK